MDLKAIKEATLNFFKTYYAEHGKPPSVKLAWTEVKGLTRRNFYEIFKGGVAEACRLSGIPVPEDRIKATSKARNEREEAPRTSGKLDEEIQAEEAEAALEVEKKRMTALERVRKADVERLELEAMVDPKKVVAYLRTLEPEIVDSFFEICEEAELTTRKGWSEAVGVLGQTWEEWGRIIRADGEEPHFKGYVFDVIDHFVSKKRLELAKERHREDVYDFTCWRCGERYEFQVKEKGALLSCPNGCKTRERYESFYKICLVCRDLGEENLLSYDPSHNRFYCETCGHRIQVKGPSLAPKGARGEYIKKPIEELEKVKGLNVTLNETQRQINVGKRNVQVLKQKREKEEISLDKLRAEKKKEERELDEARGETAKERRLASSLKRENSASRRKREVTNAIAEFLMDPEMITGKQLADVVKTLSVSLEMRGQQGRVGEAMKMTVKTRGKLLKMVAGAKYVLEEDAEKRLSQQLSQQQVKHDRQLKLKDSQIAAERRRRETAEREREALAPWRDEDMKKVERENRRLRDRILILEGKNSDLKSKLHLQRIMASS